MLYVTYYFEIAEMIFLVLLDVPPRFLLTEGIFLFLPEFQRKSSLAEK